MSAQPGELAHARNLNDPRIYPGLWVMQTSVAAAQAAVVSAAPVPASLFWALVCALSLGLGLSYRAKALRLHFQLANGAALIGLMAFLTALLSDLANALLTLLLWLLVAKNITLARERDAYFTIAISLVVLVFGAAESRSGWFLLAVTVYTLGGLFTLALMHVDDLRHRALAEHPRQGFAAPLPTSVLPLTLGVLLLAGVFYLLMPTPPATHWGSYMSPGGQDYGDRQWERQAGTGEISEGPDTADKAQHRSSGSPSSDPGYAGFSDRLDIDKAGRQGVANAIVLYVQAPEPLYLTGKVFDTFDGERWTATRADEQKIALQYGRHRFDMTPSADEEEQDIEATVDLPPVLFGASRVVEVGFPGPVIAVDRLGSLRIPRPLAKGTRYEVLSRVQRLKGRPLVEEQILDGEAYLQLPQRLDPAIAALAAEITARQPTPLAKAIALEQYLRTRYQYSFESIFTSQGHTPLSEFLFKTHKGHCEYFASALAIMLRTQGIASRLVTGYAATTYNPLTGYLEVRALDGHAWVQAYIPERGWAALEPTPAYDLPPAPQTLTTSQRLERYAKALVHQSELSGENRAKRRWLPDIAEAFTLINQAMAHLWHLLTAALWTWIAANRWLLATVLGGLALGIGAFRQLQRPLRDRLAKRRIDRARNGDPSRLAVLCVCELQAWLARRDLPRADHLTLEEYAEGLSREKPRFQAPLAVLIELFSRARYSTEKLDPEEAISAYEAFSRIVSSTDAKT